MMISKECFLIYSTFFNLVGLQVKLIKFKLISYLVIVVGLLLHFNFGQKVIFGFERATKRN